MNNILDIAKNIAQKLNIDSTKLIEIIKKKNYDKNFDSNIHQNLIRKIYLLLENDTRIQAFEEKLDSSVKINFYKLKENLAELQLLILLKNIKKSKSNSDILNTFIKILDQKIDTINDVLASDLSGGGINNTIRNIKNIKYIIN